MTVSVIVMFVRARDIAAQPGEGAVADAVFEPYWADAVAGTQAATLRLVEMSYPVLVGLAGVLLVLALIGWPLVGLGRRVIWAALRVGWLLLTLGCIFWSWQQVMPEMAALYAQMYDPALDEAATGYGAGCV